MCVCTCLLGIEMEGSMRDGEIWKEKTNVYLIPFMSRALCQALLHPLAQLHKNFGDRYYFLSFPRWSNSSLEMLNHVPKTSQLTCDWTVPWSPAGYFQSLCSVHLVASLCIACLSVKVLWQCVRHFVKCFEVFRLKKKVGSCHKIKDTLLIMIK